LAYAITIHKSQGSEFPAVVIPLATQHYMLLQRNLIYTGITRGKRLLVLIGQRKATGGQPLEANELYQEPIMLSAKSRLRFVEHAKEQSHAETSKRIDEPREQHCRGGQSPQDIEDGGDERPR
jgi:superfamily I DNA/RNA helicase